MRKLTLIPLLLLAFSMVSLKAGAWGSTGHRAIAEIAWHQLNKTSREKLHAVLGDDYLPLFCTWADDIRSEKDNPMGKLPHYVNMPFTENYQSSVKNPKGDLVTVMNDMVAQYKKPQSTKEEKAAALKFIIHLIGDIHQPMHVGLAEDLGGNKVDVTWFGTPSNLHRVWDENLIDNTRLSYIELARFAGIPSSKQLKQLLKSNLIDWVDETHGLTKLVYDNIGDKKYSYDYAYQFAPVVYQQIQKAGYRLGDFLNHLLAE